MQKPDHADRASEAAVPIEFVQRVTGRDAAGHVVGAGIVLAIALAALVATYPALWIGAPVAALLCWLSWHVARRAVVARRALGTVVFVARIQGGVLSWGRTGTEEHVALRRVRAVTVERYGDEHCVRLELENGDCMYLDVAMVPDHQELVDCIRRIIGG